MHNFSVRCCVSYVHVAAAMSAVIDTQCTCYVDVMAVQHCNCMFYSCFIYLSVGMKVNYCT